LLSLVDSVDTTFSGLKQYLNPERRKRVIGGTRSSLQRFLLSIVVIIAHEIVEFVTTVQLI